MHIGFKFWQLLGKICIERESKSDMKTAVLNKLLSEQFLRVFVRGISIQKGVLFDLSKEIKASLITMLS